MGWDGAMSGTVALDGQRYDGVFRTLHWVILVLVLLQYGSKLLPPGTLSFSEAQLNAWHLAIGPTILLLMLVRLVWRLTHPVPPPPADLPPLLQAVSRLTHWGFYALLIVLPLLGWVSANAYGARPTLLGVVPLPSLAGQDKAYGEAIGRLHGLFAWALLALLAAHVAGALYHAVVKRDGVVRRMA
jgi:cytochrome b561